MLYFAENLTLEYVDIQHPPLVSFITGFKRLYFLIFISILTAFPRAAFVNLLVSCPRDVSRKSHS